MVRMVLSDALLLRIVGALLVVVAVRCSIFGSSGMCSGRGNRYSNEKEITCR